MNPTTTRSMMPNRHPNQSGSESSSSTTTTTPMVMASLIPVSTTTDPAVTKDYERERQMAIFVRDNFVPVNERGDLDRIILKLRPSGHHQGVPDYLLDQTFSNSTVFDENSEDWQDLMQWENPTLHECIESRLLYMFQWRRTHNYLVTVRAMFSSNNKRSSPEFVEQRRSILRSIMSIRQRRNLGLANPGSPSRMHVPVVIWKLRGLLFTIPTPATSIAKHSANVRLMKFQQEIGLKPCQEINDWILAYSPLKFLLFLVAMYWVPPPQQQQQPQPLKS